jgi:hypothetical protein
VAVPGVIGLLAGIGLMIQTGRLQQRFDRQDELHRAWVEVQLLSEMVDEEIEVIRSQATALALLSDLQSQQSAILPTGRILFWAEVGFQKSAWVVKLSARNSLWNAPPAQETQFLQSILPRVQSGEISKRGIEFLPVSDTRGTSGTSGSRGSQGHSLLFLAFPYHHDTHDTQVAEPSIVLALVDPSSAFASFQRWSAHSSRGRSRAYLIGADGYVLNHTQPSWIAANLGELELFQNQILPLFSGKALSGSLTAIGADQLPVEAAYVRLGQSPLALVVEHMMPPPIRFQVGVRLLTLACMLAMVLGWVIYGVSAFLQKLITKTAMLHATAFQAATDRLPRTASAKTAHDHDRPDSLDSLRGHQKFLAENDSLLLDIEGPRERPFAPGQGPEQ